MRLSTAVKFIILAHASCYVPSVLCEKRSMREDTATTTTVDGGNSDEKMLSPLEAFSSKDYYYRRN
jgi:hypothetical protein